MDWMPALWMLTLSIAASGWFVFALHPDEPSREGAKWMCAAAVLAALLGLIHLGAWLATGATA